jgi:hypothetical protein
MDASIDVYCTLLRHQGISFFVRYRDDLDMAFQTGGVSLDPRYAHYYITGGIGYNFLEFSLLGYFMHDCVHDIDYEVTGTPVFNRFRLQLKNQRKIFFWCLDGGIYPHWQYHGWDINAGADYKYDFIAQFGFNLLRKEHLAISFNPKFQIARGDTCFYHQDILSSQSCYINNNREIGLRLDYHLLNNDPIKSPDKLWLLSIFVAF